MATSSFGFAAAIMGLLEAAMLSQPASMAIATPESVAVPAPRMKRRRAVETSFKRRIPVVMTAPSRFWRSCPLGQEPRMGSPDRSGGEAFGPHSRFLRMGSGFGCSPDGAAAASVREHLALEQHGSGRLTRGRAALGLQADG